MFKTLKHVNFGPSFISYVKLMYNNIESTVLNNGSNGNYFKSERSVRQSCPLSAYLFILVIEVLANKIRNDPDIKGIKIDNKEIKISLLADNITLILKDLLSLENSLKTFKLFQHCSGLKQNIDKTKGIFITNDTDENLNLNFRPRIANLINLLMCGNLFLKGKIIIINTIALALLIYLSITIDTPDKAIAQVNNIIQTFL